MSQPIQAMPTGAIWVIHPHNIMSTRLARSGGSCEGVGKPVTDALGGHIYPDLIGQMAPGPAQKLPVTCGSNAVLPLQMAKCGIGRSGHLHWADVA